jgi:acyl carrier protein
VKASEAVVSGPTIESQIKTFIARKLLFTDDEYSFTDDTSFVEETIIDSLGVMELVSFVRTTFGVEVDPTEVTPDNFDSVAKIAAFVRGKTAGELIA